ncbi:MAG: alpha-L-fucosidase [Phycisphaerales bacterium JB039]
MARTILRAAAAIAAAAAMCVMAPGPVLAQDDAGAGGAGERPDDRMDWWRQARFGLFIHWGLYAVPAGKWGERDTHGEWIMTTAQIPVEEYEQFVPQFNPVNFDADEWCLLAKQAGMKYIVITSKHHDGFCLFDSEYTDYDIMSTPFARDIMKELADACRRHGLKICWYHSIMDWHHPDYLPRRNWEDRSAEGAEYSRFVEYLHGQVTELLTNYGPIGVMWFDGEWEGTWTRELGNELYELCRSIQPDVIVNNRVSKGRAGMAGMTTGPGFAGDFGTPEQEIPATGLPGVDWETCMTMNRHWGYNAADDQYKSTEDLVRKLIDIASKGGNFLLNVGPQADGTFPPESVRRLREIGAWMSVNGEAISGTTASPFDDIQWGRCTVKRRDGGATLYFHVFDWPDDGVLTVSGLGNRVRSARLLGAPQATIAAGGRDGRLEIIVPQAPAFPYATVVAVEIEGDPIVYQTPRIEPSSEVFVRSAEVALATRSGNLEIRYTLDGADPGPGATRYSEPITITDTTTIRARSFHEGKPVSDVASMTVRRVEPAPGAPGDGLAPGLLCETFAGDWDRMPDFDVLKPTARHIAETITPDPYGERIGRRYRGMLRIDEPEVYRIVLRSDDGSRLFVNGALAIDNDGLHGAEEKSAAIALGRGWHDITVEWFNKTGGADLALLIAPVGDEPGPVPPAHLRHRP